MKAKILPLSDKYYGTIIEVETDNLLGSNKEIYEINVWMSSVANPSERELKGICTPDEWKNNKKILYNGQWLNAKEVYRINDSHFESQVAYETAQKIVKALHNS